MRASFDDPVDSVEDRGREPRRDAQELDPELADPRRPRLRRAGRTAVPRAQLGDADRRVRRGAASSEGALAFVSLTDVDAAARLLSDALAGIDAPKNPRAAVRPTSCERSRLAAAEAVLARSSRPPLTELERRALERAAALLGGGRRSPSRRAHLRGAGETRARRDAWGAIGDLERMEAALAREEARATARREAVDAMRRFDALLSAGERRAALALAAPVRQHRGRGDRATAGGAHRRAAGARRRRQPAHPGREPGAASARLPARHRPRSRRRGHAARSRRCRAATPCCAPARRDHRRRRRLARRHPRSAARASTLRCRCAARASSASATAPRWRSRPPEPPC